MTYNLTDVFFTKQIKTIWSVFFQNRRDCFKLCICR